MKQLRAIGRYFTVGEWLLWGISAAVIVASFCLFDRESYLTLAASLIGVTSLIFAAKGNPISQVLMVVFSILYGIISYTFAYYGEMITYLGMTMPMAVYLTFRRSPYYALAYAANDAVLIVLWIMAAVYEVRYISVAVCFIAFLVNDLYGFISWRRMARRQRIA